MVLWYLLIGMSGKLFKKHTTMQKCPPVSGFLPSAQPLTSVNCTLFPSHILMLTFSDFLLHFDQREIRFDLTLWPILRWVCSFQTHPLFISKITEKIVAKKLLEVMEAHNTFHKFQSGFRKRHSTQSVLLSVTNDILISADCGQCTLLVLLDFRRSFWYCGL